ncbi:MAG: DNA/RNA non-specific endonuclease [Gaiellaceae bacterium]
MPREPTEPAFDPDYSNRCGFDPAFLGVRVPLPELPADADPTPLRDQPDEHVLHYEHFSVVMSRPRRLAYFVGVNIDGKRIIDLGDREGDRWIFDSRIAREDQFGNPLYDDNPFDRGHLVRRLDVVWGATSAEAEKAQADTFHFTNCAPQHERFNRLKKFWYGIEHYILSNTGAHGLRVSVFSGPVLAEEDPPLGEGQVPTDFWKVVAMRRVEGPLSAAAYLLSQAELIPRVTDEFVFGEYKLFMKAVWQIEERTGLDFGQLRDHDAFAKHQMLDAQDHPIELTRYEDIVI